MTKESPSSRTRKIMTARRRWRMFRIGCFPAMILSTACVFMFAIALAWMDMPYWMTISFNDLIAGSLSASLLVLLGVQILSQWGSGIMAAVAASSAVSGRGETLGKRLPIIRRRTAVMTWALLVLRLLIVVNAIFVVFLLFSSGAGNWVQVDVLATMLRMFLSVWWLGIPVAAIALIQWLVGPYLHLRYSIALGVLGAAWEDRHERRSWTALSMWMGSALLGVMTLVWGVPLLVLIALAILDPISSDASYSGFILFPWISGHVGEAVTAYVMFGGFLFLNLVGQIIMPPIYLGIAQARLSRRIIPGPEAYSFMKRAGQATRESSLPVHSESS